MADLVVAEVERRAVPIAQITTSPYMTVSETAHYLRCKRQRVYDLLSSRRLTRVKDGSRTLIKRVEVETYLLGGGFTDTVR